MTNRTLDAAAALAISALLLATSTHAQIGEATPEELKIREQSQSTGGPPPPPIADARNLNGLWKIRNTILGGYSARAGDRREVQPASATPGPANADQRACVPYFQALSFPLGSTHIVQTPDLIVFFFEDQMRSRTIFMNVDPPANVKPSIYGSSVGRWEGDTLVVDTVGFAGWIGTSGYRATPTLRLQEKFRKTDGGTRLEDKLTWSDLPGNPKPPERLSDPVVAEWSALDILEAICEDGGQAFWNTTVR